MSNGPSTAYSILSLPHSNNRLALDAIPRQLDPLQERLHRKQRLAASYRLFARYGYEVGLAGHFTARDPIETDHYWINPLGVPFSKISVSQLLRVDADGQVVEGEGLLNTSALELHHGLQRARPEVVGIAHLHGFYGRTWSSLGQLFDPITLRPVHSIKIRSFFLGTNCVLPMARWSRTAIELLAPSLTVSPTTAC